MGTAGQHHLSLVVVQLAGHRVVVLVDHLHEHEQQAHRQDRDPRPGKEFGDQDDQQHRPGHDETDGVDDPGADHLAAHRRVGLGLE